MAATPRTKPPAVTVSTDFAGFSGLFPKEMEAILLKAVCEAVELLLIVILLVVPIIII